MTKNTDDCTESQCGSCQQDCDSRKAPPAVTLKPGSHVKKTIGVVSGKGGVGKSLVTTLLALDMKNRGYNTAILDADLTGPSIPHGLGLDNERAHAVENGLLPVISKHGIKAMSVNLLLEDTNSPVLWRGPVIGGVVKQFWTDVHWGDVDVMLIDMPPGTGDVAMTVFQSLPVDGLIIVASPQDLVAMIVSKAVNMANTMKVPVLGLVENMAYVQCPDCGKKIEVFGPSHVQETADKFGLPVLGRLPMDGRFAKAYDEGDMQLFDDLWPKGIGDAVAATLDDVNQLN